MFEGGVAGERKRGLDGECVRGVCTGGISQDPRSASSDPRMRE